MRPEQVKRVVEAALLAADEPVSLDRLVGIFTEDELAAAAAEQAEQFPADEEPPDAEPEHEASDNARAAEGDAEGQAPSPRAAVREALAAIERETEGHGYELARVASGYRFQVRRELGPWVSRLFEEKPPRYSRALLETLALIAYRQPITRAEVEDVRGVSVAASIMRTLSERGWIRAVGQRETPGRPTMYGTTRAFLDYFNLRALRDLPPLEEIKALIEPLLDESDEDEAGEAAQENQADALDAEAPSNVVRLPGTDAAQT